MGRGPGRSRESPAPAGSVTASSCPGRSLTLIQALTTAHHSAWLEGGRRGERKPRAAALRNLWITADAAERAAVLDWQRASYVLYQGLDGPSPSPVPGRRWTSPATARAIETAVATTIIGSVDEVIEGLREVAAAGVDDVVLRIAVEGAPQAAIHGVMGDFADGVFPVLADAERWHAHRGDTPVGQRSRARSRGRVRRRSVRPRRRCGRHRVGDRRAGGGDDGRRACSSASTSASSIR